MNWLSICCLFVWLVGFPTTSILSSSLVLEFYPWVSTPVTGPATSWRPSLSINFLYYSGISTIFSWHHALPDHLLLRSSIVVTLSHTVAEWPLDHVASVADWTPNGLRSRSDVITGWKDWADSQWTLSLKHIGTISSPWKWPNQC